MTLRERIEAASDGRAIMLDDLWPLLWAFGPTCGALMPVAGERCARTPGHETHHRSAYAMANARRKGLAA